MMVAMMVVWTVAMMGNYLVDLMASMLVAWTVLTKVERTVI